MNIFWYQFIIKGIIKILRNEDLDLKDEADGPAEDLEEDDNFKKQEK